MRRANFMSAALMLLALAVGSFGCADACSVENGKINNSVKDDSSIVKKVSNDFYLKRNAIKGFASDLFVYSQTQTQTTSNSYSNFNSADLNRTHSQFIPTISINKPNLPMTECLERVAYSTQKPAVNGSNAPPDVGRATGFAVNLDEAEKTSSEQMAVKYFNSQFITNSPGIELLAYDNINDAVSSTDANKEYEMSANETLVRNFGNLAGTILEIIGNNYGISSGGYTVLNIPSGKTLIVNSVGLTAGTIEGGNFAVVNSWNGFTSTGTGGAIYNNGGTVTIEDSVFSSNTASTGGAIANTNSGTMTISGSVFTGNTGQYGASIWNNGTLSVTDTIFYKNEITGDSNNDRAGGGIFNERNLLLVDNSKFIDNIGVYGGAIYNKSGWTITLIKDSEFSGNTVSGTNSTNHGGAGLHNRGTVTTIQDSVFTNNATKGSGGAIFNTGTIGAIIDTSFTNNWAVTYGGAIYNAGTITIVANNDDVIFEGNKLGTVTIDADGNASISSTYTLNDIYNNGGGGIRLNANTGKSIVFNGTITGSNKDIYIGNTTATVTQTGGTYQFNNAVSGNSFLLYNNPNIKMGSYTDPNTNETYYGKLTLNNFYTYDNHGANLDTQNNHAEAHSLGRVNIQGDIILSIDADLGASTPAIDNFTASSFSSSNGSRFVINSVKIVSDAVQKVVSYVVANDVLREYFSLATEGMEIEGLIPGKSYILSYSTTTGKLTFTSESVFTTLYDAIHNPDEERIYSMAEDEDLTQDLGTMDGTNASLVISGNNYSINGNAKQGIYVGAGNTLTINDVGLYEDDIVRASWNGMDTENLTDHDASVATVYGTLNVNDSVFYYNQTTYSAGVFAVYGNGFIQNSTFIRNSGNVAGAVMVAGANGKALITDSLFKNNNAEKSGAVAVNDTGAYAKISGSEITGNYASTNGGAVYNKGEAVIQTSDVESNIGGTAGAVDNSGKVTLIDTDVKNNSTSGTSGAISNKGTVQVVADTKDVVFQGNKAGATITDNGDGTYSASGGMAVAVTSDRSVDTNVNLNAASGKTIIFNDALKTTSGSHNANLNLSGSSNTYTDMNTSGIQSTTTINKTGGTYVFNNAVDGYAMKMNNNAQVQMGSTTVNGGTSYGTLNLTSFENDANGGKIDTQNNHIETHKMGTSFVLNSDLRVGVDADLVNEVADKFVMDDNVQTVNFNGHSIIINAIKVIVDAPSEDPVSVTVADGNLKSAFKLTTDEMEVNGVADDMSYLVTYSVLTGKLTFKGSLSPSTTLHDAVQDTTAFRNYTMRRSENVTEDLGTMGGDGSILSINGGGYSVNANGYKGITVKSGQTLHIRNVGTWTTTTDDEGRLTDAQITRSWNGSSMANGAVLHVNSGGVASVENSAFTNNKAPSGEGGVIYNEGTLTELSGVFKNNSTSGGDAGAIRNTGVIVNGTADFIGNYIYGGSASNGGAIYNTGTIVKLTANFIGNYNSRNNTQAGYGGAFISSGGNSRVGSLVGYFKGNYVSTLATNNVGGGALRSSGEAKTYEVIADFDENYAIGGSGGAVYAQGQSGQIVLVDSSFTNNAATVNGGAISSHDQQVRLIADKKDILFHNNRVGAITNNGDGTFTVDEDAEYNDIYTGRDLSLNAAEGRTITFDGKVQVGSMTVQGTPTKVVLSYDNETGAVTSTNETINQMGGTYIFNNVVNISTSFFKNDAHIKLGSVVQDNGDTTYGVLNISRFGSQGGLHIDSMNDHIDTTSLGVIGPGYGEAVNGTLNVSIDVDLAGTTTGGDAAADKIVATSLGSYFSSSSNFAIEDLNIMSKLASSERLEINVFNDVLKGRVKNDWTVKKIDGLIDGSDYYVTYQAATGNLLFGGNDIFGLYLKIHETDAVRNYEMSYDEDVPVNLGTMEGENSTLNIDGNGHSITGNGYNGVTVESGQTLNIDNVGTWTEVLDDNNRVVGANVTKSWNDFVSNEGGAIYINNGATVNITDSAFVGNTALSNRGGAIFNAGRMGVLSGVLKENTASKGYGGALYNATTGLIIDLSADFIGNYAINSNHHDGGAIYNQGKIYEVSGNFIGNYVYSTSDAHGGAISIGHASNTAIGKVTGLFKGNYAQSTGTGARGGALYMRDGGHYYEISADFEENYAIGGYGGAIEDDYGPSYIIDATFKNNAATVNGGAYWVGSNSYIIADQRDVVFTGNKVGTITNDGEGNFTITNYTYNDVAGNSTILLNAASGRRIRFDGSVVNPNNNAWLDINRTDSNHKRTVMTYRPETGTIGIDTDVLIDQVGGIYQFNNNVEKFAMHLYTGSHIKLGEAEQTDGTTSHGKLMLRSFQTEGGDTPVTIDSQNNYADSHQLGSDVILRSNVNVLIDADLAGATTDDSAPGADQFSVTTFHRDNQNYRKFVIKDISIVSKAATDDMLEVNVADELLKGYFQLEGDIKAVDGVVDGSAYYVTYQADTGNLLFGGQSVYGLYFAVHTPDVETYTLSADSENYVNLGTLEGENRSLVIDGAGHDVNGHQHSGITIQEGQSLTIKNVGMTEEGEVVEGAKGWNSFGTNSIFVNEGILDIQNVILSENIIVENDVYGGLIKNTGIVNNITGQILNNSMGGATSQTAYPSYARGGTLIENNGGLIKNIDVNMSGNWVSYNNMDSAAGLIWNRTAASNILSISGNFSGNYVMSHDRDESGIISNLGKIGSITGVFSNNGAFDSRNNHTGYGAAIRNYNGAYIYRITADFIGNYVFSTVNTNQGRGGAIDQNNGNMYFIDSTFTDNMAGNSGGAISINNGSMYMISENRDTILTNNMVGNIVRDNETGAVSMSGAIKYIDLYFGDNGWLYLNADEDRAVVFDGSIVTNKTNNNPIIINRDNIALYEMTYNEDTQTINVETTGNAPIGGDYVFNSPVGKIIIGNYGGNIILGSKEQEDGTTTYGSFDIGRYATYQAVGSIDTRNNHIDTNSFGNVGQDNNWRMDFDTILKLDVDLGENPASDVFNGTAGGYIRNNSKFIIKEINLITEALTDDLYSLTVTSNSLKNYFRTEGEDESPVITTRTEDGTRYIATYQAGSNDGKLLVGKDNLYNEIHLPIAERTYTMEADEEVTKNLGTMEGDNSTLTVEGNGYDVNGNNHGGVTVQAGQTMNVRNVGMDEDGNITGEGFHGFYNSRVFINNGTLDLQNVVFSGNTTNNANIGVSNNAGGIVTNYTGAFINHDINITQSTNAGMIYGAGASDAKLYNMVLDIKDNNFISTGTLYAVIVAWSGAPIGNIDIDVENNKIFSGGMNRGAIIFSCQQTTQNISGTFKNNVMKGTSQGGLINGYQNYIRNITADFEDNIAIGVTGSVLTHTSGGEERFVDSTFKNNWASNSAAIYTEGGLRIYAVDKNVIFTGNRIGEITDNGDGTYTIADDADYIDVYSTNYMNLVAAEGKSITFDGKVTGSAGLNLNMSNEVRYVWTGELNSDSVAVQNGGDYIFNNLVSGKALSLYNNANVKLGSKEQSNGTTTYGHLDLVSLTNDTNGGVISAQNGHIDENNLGAVTLKSNLILKFDVDLAGVTSGGTPTIDKYNISSVTGSYKFIMGGFGVGNRFIQIYHGRFRGSFRC